MGWGEVGSPRHQSGFSLAIFSYLARTFGLANALRGQTASGAVDTIRTRVASTRVVKEIKNTKRREIGSSGNIVLHVTCFGLRRKSLVEQALMINFP